MKEIRIHGRGGQGAVLAAELLVVAAFEDGKYGQAFPAFGGERRGAPVQAFVRLDAAPVRVRYRVTEPDYVVILDGTLPNMVDVLAGLKPRGLALIDSEVSPAGLAWSTEADVYAVPATRIALDVFGQPLVNPAMLGALAAATGEISLEAVQRAYVHRFPGAMGEKNGRAARMGHDFVRSSAVALAAGNPPAPVRVIRSSRAPGAGPAWSRDDGLGGPGRPLHFGLVAAPRTALAYPTGAWRYNRPLIDGAVCNGCGVCQPLCPDSCLAIVDKKAVVDYDYCKGCGICAQECTRGAVAMVSELGAGS